MGAVVPDVAIVSHNTDYYLLNLLNSLELLQGASLVGTVHVWDNGSTDRTGDLGEAYAAAHDWVRIHSSAENLHHGPAIDRLLRDVCESEWVLLLDADTEIRRPFGGVLQTSDLAGAAFVGQIHPQMPQLYAYLAHLLVHRPQYFELPAFRHHGAPALDYFSAIERQRRPFLRFRWCDYIYHFRQGALRRLVERGDRSNEFYEFAARVQVDDPKSAARVRREQELQASLETFLVQTRRGTRRRPATREPSASRSVGATFSSHETGERRNHQSRFGLGRRDLNGVTDWFRSPRRALALKAAKRLGLVQIGAEAARLARIVQRHQPRRIVEIGTAHGGSFLLWARVAAPDAALVSIDLPPWELDDPDEELKRRTLERIGSRRQSIHVLRGDSHDPEVKRQALECLDGQPIDFLFIDGDHTYGGVRKDFDDYASAVRQGGIVALHDIHPHSRGWGGEVPLFWNEIRDRYRHVELIANRDQDGFGIGVIWR